MLWYKYVMKRIYAILGCMILLASPVGAFAQDGEVYLNGANRPEIELPQLNYKEKDTLVINDEEIMDQIVKMQREKDLEDQIIR